MSLSRFIHFFKIRKRWHLKLTVMYTADTRRSRNHFVILIFIPALSRCIVRCSITVSPNVRRWSGGLRETIGDLRNSVVPGERSLSDYAEAGRAWDHLRRKYGTFCVEYLILIFLSCKRCSIAKKNISPFWLLKTLPFQHLRCFLLLRHAGLCC